MKRLFLDANVIFSAAISPRGRCRAFFNLAHHGYCQLLTSPHAITETERNLMTKYPQHLDQYREQLLPTLLLVPEASFAKVEWAMTMGLPLKDAPILASAVTAGADYLVTGDKQHFSPLYGKIVGSTKILDPQGTLSKLL